MTKTSENKLNFRSKAETLQELSTFLESANVPTFIYFSVEQWQADPKSLLTQVRESFDGMVVVRSSSKNEDSETSSKAGLYESILDVNSRDETEVRVAVEAVVNSYQVDDGATNSDLILIQEQVQDVAYDGVLFTRSIETNAPYFVINYGQTGRTDTATSGRSVGLKVVAHAQTEQEPKHWQSLIDLAVKIEQLAGGQALDIEFAIEKDGRVRILQVRPLASNHGLPVPDQTTFFAELSDMESRLSRYLTPSTHLYGSRTIFSDMTDWNPSEIIGDRPNTLSYSMYRYIVTDEIWHLARTKLGYFDASPGELMVSFGRKPYIDVRLSFNSLTPAQMTGSLREKLINFYLDQLESNPELHDKVEHDILLTCYEFGIGEQLKRLAGHGFTNIELEEITSALRQLTNDIIERSSSIFNDALVSTQKLTNRRNRILLSLSECLESPWDCFSAAFALLSDCRYYGTLPFSVAARMAFIAKQLLLGLDHEVEAGFSSRYLKSLTTVTSRFQEDSIAFSKKQMPADEFFDQYGHLRPSTYDICAPRYDEIPALVVPQDQSDTSSHSNSDSPISSTNMSAIDRAMREHRLYGNHEILLSFISRATRYRELLKFEFTKNLSDALRLLTRGGDLLGISREDLSNLTLRDCGRLRNPEHSNPDKALNRLTQTIERNKKRRDQLSAFMLPSILFKSTDFRSFEIRAAKPNFVGDQCVMAPSVQLSISNDKSAQEIKGKIVLIENADPGYDWIFNCSIKGLITKYGGVTSHMAIRCSELGIPGAIGCGELAFEQLKNASSVLLDCCSKKVEPMGS